MLLGLENEKRQMEMVDCACAVSEGTGQKPPAPLSWHRPPWQGLLGGREMLLCC